MFSIILKIILCSSIFIAVYYLLLEKEKMYRFNRFYLIGSLILAYIIPFITVTSEAQISEMGTKPQLIFEEATQQMVFVQPMEESFNWTNTVWICYAAVTVILLIRNISSIAAIKKIQGRKQIYQRYHVVLTKKGFSPFSFWNTIYLGENYMQNNMIDPRIFLHEKSHLDQKHSIDLMFIQLLKIFTWFNPVLFIYKKAMTTNHEFLADEAVLNSKFNMTDYQNLILDEIVSSQGPSLTHSFNFNNTKKRFIMMNTKKSKFILLKKAAGFTALVAATALFAEKKYVNTVADMPGSKEVVYKSPGNTTVQDPYKEFKDILNRYSDLLNNRKYAEFSKKVTEEDKARLEELYAQLTDAQKDEQKITFISVPALKKRIPTEKELSSFLNKSNYAVWIDSKKIENSSLKNYKTSDFSHVSISKVYKNARTARNPQPYQVSLMTPPFFEKSQKEMPFKIMGFKGQAYKGSPNIATSEKSSGLKQQN